LNFVSIQIFNIIYLLYISSWLFKTSQSKVTPSMAWPTHNDNDNFQISEAGYPWSTIDPNGWGTHFVKQPHAFYISPSPEPPFTTNLLTETPYTHELQLPSTPNSIGSIPSPGLPYSNMTGDNKSTKEVDLEHFILQRNDAATFPARSCEPGYRSLCDGPVANPQKGSTMISPHGSSHSCVAKSKSRRYSRLSSSKDKKYAFFI
jgi:hypothetical protein